MASSSIRASTLLICWRSLASTTLVLLRPLWPQHITWLLTPQGLMSTAPHTEPWLAPCCISLLVVPTSCLPPACVPAIKPSQRSPIFTQSNASFATSRTLHILVYGILGTLLLNSLGIPILIMQGVPSIEKAHQEDVNSVRTLTEQVLCQTHPYVFCMY